MKNQPNEIADIVIVGGGTAGWMSASYLKKSFPDKNITVIESLGVKRIGVGEATLPNLQSAFWDYLGIPEAQWMRRVNATFKMGIKFVDWTENPAHNKEDYYYHFFGVLPNCNNVPLSQYWAYNKLVEGTNKRYDYACYKEPYIADALRSPVRSDGQKVSSYAWHFDANLVAEYLKEISLGWGVNLIAEHVETATRDERGFISEVLTREGSKVSGDFFIDCTGFRSEVIGKILDEPFINKGDNLLCNSAVATQLPADNAADGLAPYTVAAAHSAGWSWKIPLLGRNGAGYVYSGDFLSVDEAIHEFSSHLNIDPDKHQWNKIKFRVGRRERSWVNNCVAIGLSSNFLEPLESTALYLTYGALHQLVRFFPDKNCDQKLRDSFNNELNYSYDDCLDFVQMHYISTNRTDTAFWKANQNDLKVSESLLEKLEQYKSGSPINNLTIDADEYYNDFNLEYRNFWAEGNYFSVLTGMRKYSEKVNPEVLNNPESRNEAKRMFDEIRQKGLDLAESLPSNYDYLNSFHHVKSLDKI